MVAVEAILFQTVARAPISSYFRLLLKSLASPPIAIFVRIELRVFQVSTICPLPCPRIDAFTWVIMVNPEDNFLRRFITEKTEAVGELIFRRPRDNQVADFRF